MPVNIKTEALHFHFPFKNASPDPKKHFSFKWIPVCFSAC